MSGRHPRRRAVCAALVLAVLPAVAALAPATPAGASRTQESIFQDDATLILGGDAKRERALDDLAILGVDTVHSVVFWNRVAPAAGQRRPPAGFDGSDPSAYPAEAWDRYDALVRGAAARGMEVLLSPSSPLPAWASDCGGSLRKRRTCNPNPTQFKRFVTALGTRYSGEYPDENQGGGVLPRVTRWSVFNEPNLGGWLTPQYVMRGGRRVPSSPARYRELVRAAVKALRATGHGSDEILMGETAPIGRVTGPLATRPIPPGDFFRTLLCIDAGGRKLSGRAASDLRCRGFRRLGVSGVSHHPYTRGGSRPPRSAASANEITISSIGRLKRILDQAARRGRIGRRLPILYTEFGFQTDPPDTLFGVSLDEQAAFINEADWIAFRDPRVRAVAQYELYDEPSLAAFQTGLRFADGRAKPAFGAYRMPIWVTRAGSRRVRVFGQIRPADDDAAETVEIQNRPSSGGDFVTVSTETVLNRKGYIVVTVPRRPGVWRLRWSPAQGGSAITSRIAEVAPR